VKVFLDVGAHVGETLEGVLDPRYGFERIWCFEPVASCCEALRAFSDPRVVVCPFGLAGETGEMLIYGAGGLGGSLFADKQGDDSAELCRFVRASEWFSDHLAPGDDVYLKLNCEGSECDVLDDLLDSGEILKVTVMAVYWDVRKIPSQRHREHEVRARLDAAGLGNHVDAKLVMRGPTGVARTQRWLDAVGADVDSRLLKWTRRVRYVALLQTGLRARAAARRLVPTPVLASVQRVWRVARYGPRH
jgi:FkbM family methyltransferase